MEDNYIKSSSSFGREKKKINCDFLPIIINRCKPGEAYTRLKTASCEAGPGTTHMWTLEICIWSLQIPDNADKCALDYSTFGFSK